MKGFKVILTLATVLFVTACAGKQSTKVSAMQSKDKKLNCKEVMLEINEAEFYRKAAEKNKNPGVGSVLMPVGYISTYVDANKAVDAANSRVEYLNRIYDILDCDSKQANPVNTMVPVQPMMQAPYQAPYVSGAAAGQVYRPINYAPRNHYAQMQPYAAQRGSTESYW